MRSEAVHFFAVRVPLVLALVAGASVLTDTDAMAQSSLTPKQVEATPVVQPIISEPRTSSRVPLAPGDVLSVRVGAWNIVESRYEEWGGVGGEVTVQIDGTIHLPLAGAVKAAGRSTSAIAAELADEMLVHTGLATPPSVTVSIASRRPIYIGGDVTAPGEFDFRDGLTVRQAIALAGGALRPPPEEMQTLLGRQARLEEAILRADLRVARLEAELVGAETLDAPAEMDVPGLAELVEVERKLLSARRKSLEAQELSIDALIEVLGNVRRGLMRQLQLVADEIARAEEEVARREELLERGLARATDTAGAQSQLSSLQLRQVDMNVQLLGVEKDLSEARRTRDALAQNREVTVLQELSAEQDRRRDTELEFFSVKAALAGTAVPSGGTTRYEAEVVADGATEAAPAEMSMLLRPGDTLTLRMVDE